MGWVDKAMAKYGYKLMTESQYGARYQRDELGRYDEKFSHVIYLGRKADGRHMVQSYDSKVSETSTGEYINCVCGVEIPVLILLWFKGHYMIRKYHWKKKTIASNEESSFLV